MLSIVFFRRRSETGNYPSIKCYEIRRLQRSTDTHCCCCVVLYWAYLNALDLGLKITTSFYDPRQTHTLPPHSIHIIVRTTYNLFGTKNCDRALKTLIDHNMHDWIGGSLRKTQVAIMLWWPLPTDKSYSITALFMTCKMCGRI